MTNIMDYLTWRGDLSLEQDSLCDVDYLVLCRVAYIRMMGIVPEQFEAEPITMADMAERALNQSAYEEEDEKLLQALMESRRFRDMRLIGHVDIFDDHDEEQFSAVSILLPDDTVVVAYRGTDSTIIGWKEDFNMGFADNVPAQIDSVEYIEKVAKAFPRKKLRVCGHSKGGNLAVYSAAFCAEKIQSRIMEVRNFDGPGFNKENIGHKGVKAITPKTRTYLPQSSIVGMLLEHEEDFTIVHSDSLGIFQHDLYTWEISGRGFVTEKETTGSSQFIDSTLKSWLGGMSREMRESFINGVFDLLDNCDAKTLGDLWSGKNAVAIIKTMAACDEQTRENLLYGLGILKNSAQSSFASIIEKNKEQTKKQ